MDNGTLLVEQETNYPWDGNVKLKITSPKSLDKEFRLRIPGWCKKYSIKVNDEKFNAPVENGYAVINNKWKTGDVIVFKMDMDIQVVAADERVKENVGKRAIQRGPIVYCLEEADNKDSFDRVAISPKTTFKSKFESNFLDGVTSIEAANKDQKFLLIPYYAWDNREAGKMKVWIDYKTN